MIKIIKAKNAAANELFERQIQTADVSETVAAIIKNVRENGDRALIEYTEKFDGAKISSLEVSKDEINDAMMNVGVDFLSIMMEAAKNIRAFHKNQVRPGFVMTDKPGVVLGQRVQPLDRVGIYVPAGTAPLPSTVLMNAIPAVLAGCREIIMVTPCGKDGKIIPEMLAAAQIAGVTRIFRVGR